MDNNTNNMSGLEFPNTGERIVTTKDYDEAQMKAGENLDFPNKRIEQENRQAELEQLQKNKSFLEKLRDKFKGNKKGGIR